MSLVSCPWIQKISRSRIVCSSRDGSFYLYDFDNAGRLYSMTSPSGSVLTLARRLENSKQKCWMDKGDQDENFGSSICVYVDIDGLEDETAVKISQNGDVEWTVLDSEKGELKI